jgi:hypothetical protein
MLYSNTFHFSLGQRCSHVGALLFTLQDVKARGIDSLACTSNLCKWTVPKARSSLPLMPLSDLCRETAQSTKGKNSYFVAIYCNVLLIYKYMTQENVKINCINVVTV